MARRLALALAIAALAWPSLARAVLKGDVNLDGQVTSADYSVLNQALAGSVTLTWEQRDAADVAPLGTNDLIGNGAVDSADALIFDQALQGDDVDGDGLNVAAETGGTAATNGSPFLRDTDKDGAPDDADSQRGAFNPNVAPAAPTLAVTSATTTSLSGTVSACSNTDSLPYPSACTQAIVVVAAGASCDGTPIVAPVTPTSGTWSVSGLTSGVLYTTYARSSDGALAACSSGQTAATTPTGTAAVEPMLLPLTTPTNSNPVNVSGFGAPGQEVRVFVNGVEQDFVRTFATGNPAISPNPFVVPASGAFTVPVVLDDGINRVTATAISSGSVESSVSNEVTTKYENVIPRNTVAYPGIPTNPLRILQQPTPDDPNSEEIVAGRILVLTKGDMPGFTNEYYLDHHLEAEQDSLLVLQPGAMIRFANATAQSNWKRKLTVVGTLRVRGDAANRATAYAYALSNNSLDVWGGIEIQSTARPTVLDGLRVRNTTKGVTVLGTTGSRPDLTIRESLLQVYSSAGVDASTAGQISITDTEFNQPPSGACTNDGLVVSGSTSLTVSTSIVDGARYGFKATDTPATIEDNSLDPGLCLQGGGGQIGAGIYLIGSTGSSVARRNTLSQYVNGTMFGNPKWRAGILLENSSATVEDNYLRDVVSGIEVFTSGGGSAIPLIQRNAMDDVSLTFGNPDAANVFGGVVLRDGAGGTVRWNRVTNLGFQATTAMLNGRGVFVKNAGSAAIEISENYISPILVAIHVHNSAIPSGENIVIRKNTIGRSHYTAIWLNRSDATVEDNAIRSTSNGGADYVAGIYLFECTSLVQRNSVREAKYGVKATGGQPEIIANHFADNLRAGVLVEATASGTLIRANRIEGHVTSFGAGIIVRHAAPTGTQVTIDGGNLIVANQVGIRIEGLPNTATGQPVPVIRGNTIYGNVYVGVTHNIDIQSYSTPTQTTLDFSDNFWNTTVQSEINAGIVYVSPPASGLQPLANIDFPNVVTAQNTKFFASALNATVGAANARDVYFAPDLGAGTPPVAKINFQVHDSGASIVVRICPELASACNSSTASYSSTAQTYSTGAQFVSWTGADSSGKAVAPEAYTYVLEATKGSDTQVIDSAAADAAGDYFPGVGAGSMFLSPGPPATFDGYRNDPWKVRYARNAPLEPFGPSRARFHIQPRDASGKLIAGKGFLTGTENHPDGQPIPAGPGTSNAPYLVWPSRNPVTGEILSGTVRLEIAPVPLKYYVIIVRGTWPAVTRDTGEVNLLAEPRLVYDTYEQVAAIRYKVDRASDVAISLLPPNSWDDTGAPTWQFTNVPANTNQLFEFRGHEVLGMVGVSAESSRQLVTALANEGAYTFRVRATDRVSLRTAETVVTVQIRH